MQSRIIDLFNDSCFQAMLFYYDDGKIERRIHNYVAIQYYSSMLDTLRVDSILRECMIVRDTIAYYYALQVVNSICPKKISRDLLLADSTYYCFSHLLECGQLSFAEELYDYLVREEDKLKSPFDFVWKNYVDVFSMYMMKGDVERAAEIFEEIINLTPIQSMSDPWKDRYYGYDAFIQSKEYKAMMARVYTSPGK
jgi:hypothetical protein